jgi:tetratricopeptide (TPR) repeat protein
MADSSQLGARFEKATLELFKQIFPFLGFEVAHSEPRRSGSQGGFDLFFQTRPIDTSGIRINFFIECKGASSINLLPPSEFGGKPELLDSSVYDPDYWILLSPLRYLGNDFQELLQKWKSSYPFAFVPWVREGKDANRAGLYLDLYKHFPPIYDIFKQDIPEDIRDTIPEYGLDEIIAHLKTSLDNAYDEYQESVVHKGVVPGVRRISLQAIHRSRELDTAKLARIRTGYYMLNSSDKFVWKVVCNGLDIRNSRLSEAIDEAVRDIDNSVGTIWVLGAPGCGKTTQLYRTASDCAIESYPVVMINSLDLDANTGLGEYEKYFRLIHHLHNTSVSDDDAKPLLVFIDNPAARIETITKLLSRFEDFGERFKCIFLLFEREVRYRQAEEDHFLPEYVGSNTKKIYIDNQNMPFKEGVWESFVRALNLPPTEVELAKDAFLNNPEISVAEAVVNFCKRTHNEEYRRIVMDWVDFERVARQQQWGSLIDMYKWISPVYQFGVALPTTILSKVLSDFNANEFYNLQDFFDNEEYENLPVILEGNTLRTRHELIAQWHVEEELTRSVQQRLSSVLKTIEVDDALERSVLIALLGRKNIVRRYFAHLEENDFKAIEQRAAGHPVSRRLAMMARGWIRSFKGEIEEAKEIFRAVLDEYPNNLPAILETGIMEYRLGNMHAAEILLRGLLVLDPQNLHARTELGKVYQILKRYDEAEKVLKESLVIDPEHLHARTELGKVYQILKRYDEAEKVLKESLVIDPKQLHPRTELAKVYQILGRYDEAEKVLKECIKLSESDLNSRTELAKIYQTQKKYVEAALVLKECISLSPGDLNSRTELAKVYQALKNYEEAISLLEALLKLDSQSLFARTELSKIFRAQKRYVDAEKVLNECVKISPNDLNSRTELAKVYQILGRYDEAEKVLKECIEISPNDLNSRTELGKVYQILGRYDEAEKVLKESLVIDPKQLHPRTELAKVYQILGRYDEAEKVLKESLVIDPEHLHARTELGKVYQILKRYDEAEKVLKESLVIDPKHLHARTEFARSCISQGLFRKARAEVLDYIRDNPHTSYEHIAHLMLAYLNACFRMRRYREGVDFIDKFGCQFLSAELAEEYGRLLRAYNLVGAAIFFQTALRLCKNSGRLLSEAAVCFKLAGRIDAEEILERAIRSLPNKELKYRELYNNPPVSRPMAFKGIDYSGFISRIDYERMEGAVKGKGSSYSFRWDRRYDLLYRNLKINDEVFFDISERGHAVNVEPIF